MSFDPITFNAVNKLREPIGSIKLVPSTFTSDQYIDSGSPFNPATYPELAAMYGPSPNPGSVEEIQLPASVPQLRTFMTNYVHPGTNIYGHVILAFEHDSCVYALTALGLIFKSNPNDYTKLYYYTDLFENIINYGADSGTTIPVMKNVTQAVFLNDKILLSHINVSSGSTPYCFSLSPSSLIDLSDLVIVPALLNNTTVAQVPAYTRETLIYEDGKYVGVANTSPPSGKPSIFVSTDGVNWTGISRTSLGLTESTLYVLSGVAYGNGVWVICISNLNTTMNSYTTLTSTDAVTWTKRFISGTNQKGVTAIMFSNTINKFIAYSASGGYQKMLYSDDGITWTASSQTYTQSRFINLGGGNILWDSYVSTDGGSTFTDYFPNSELPLDSPLLQGSFGILNGVLVQSNMNRYLLTSDGKFIGFNGLSLDLENKSGSQSNYVILNYINLVPESGFITPKESEATSAPAFFPPVFLDNGQVGIAVEGNLIGNDLSYAVNTYNSSFINILKTTDGGTSWEAGQVNFGMICNIFPKIYSVDNKFFMFGYAAGETLADSSLTNYHMSLVTCSSADGITWEVSKGYAYTAGLVTAIHVISGPKILAVVETPADDTRSSEVLVSSDLGLTYTTQFLFTNILVRSAKNIAMVWDAQGIISSYAYVDSTWVASAFPVTVTENNLNGMAQNSNVIVVLIQENDVGFTSQETSTVYLSYDGLSWKSISLPVTVPYGSTLSTIDDWFYLTTDSGYFLVSKDGESWSYLENESLGYDQWILPNRSSSTSAFYGGPAATYANSKFLKVSGIHNVAPHVQPSVAGSKWVIKAKH